MEAFGYVDTSGGSLLMNSYNNKIATLYLKGLLYQNLYNRPNLSTPKEHFNPVPVHM